MTEKSYGRVEVSIVSSGPLVCCTVRQFLVPYLEVLLQGLHVFLADIFVVQEGAACLLPVASSP